MMEGTNDVTIINLNGNKFPVSKSILSTKSEYFATRQFLNSTEFKIKSDIKAATFKSILAYLYTGQASLSIDNVEPIHLAAQYFHLPQLCGLTFDFKVDHFERILKKDESFIKWKLESMVAVLQSSRVTVSHENKILKFVIKWINHDFKERSKSAEDLLQNVRFSQLKKGEIMKAWEIDGQFAFAIPNALRSKVTEPRRYKKGIYLIAVGRKCVTIRNDGVNLLTFPVSIVRYCPVNGTVTLTYEFPTSEYHHPLPAPVVNNGKIYFILSEDIVVFDPWTNQLTRKTPMNHRVVEKASRSSAAYCSFKDSIYAFENVAVVHHESTLRVTYRDISGVYCVVSNTWKQLENVPQKVTDSMVLQAVVCGEYIYLTLRQSLFRFNPITEEWSEITSQFTLSKHKAAAYKTKLLFLEPDSNRHMICFDTVTEEFTECFCVPDNAKYSKLMVYNDYIYLLSDLPAATFDNPKTKETTHVFSVRELKADFMDSLISRIDSPPLKTKMNIRISNVVSFQ